MLTRRSFLRKAGLAAGAALVALGLRDGPGAKAIDLSKATGPYNGKIDLHDGWRPPTPWGVPESFPYLGEHSARRAAAYYTLYLDESALGAAGRIAREVRELFATLPDLDNIIITPETLRAVNEAWASLASYPKGTMATDTTMYDLVPGRGWVERPKSMSYLAHMRQTRPFFLDIDEAVSDA